MPKITVSLAQRRRSSGARAPAAHALARRVRRVCAAWRSILYYKYVRSTQSFDPEALDGWNSPTLGILAHFSHFRHF
jgi:hypothetical protein